MQSDSHRHSYRRENRRRRLRAAALTVLVGIVITLVGLFFWAINHPSLLSPR
jgi:cell division septal protein FtsQ